MQHQPSPILGSAFAPVEVLSGPARLQLMELLAVPGRARPILPRQLAAVALPPDDEALGAIREIIEAGLDQSALVALASYRLGAVVPALSNAEPAAFLAGAPARMRRPLAQHAAGAPLAGFTIEQISSWSGFGPKRVVQLIGAAVAAAIDSLGRPDGWLDFFDEALAAAGDGRDRAVFENDVLPLGPSVSRPELALSLGISVDRVRRLAARATQRISEALDQAPTVIEEMAATVTARLGAAAPLTAVDEVLAALGLPAAPDTRSLLLMWRAGPYRHIDGHPDWVALDGSEVAAGTSKLIGEDGGVRPLDHVVADLHRIGVHPEYSTPWLTGQAVRIGHGLVVATTGATGNVAERALHAQGQPMSVIELAEWVPGGRPAVLALFAARDRRFHLAADDRLALAEWGDTPDGVDA